MKRSELKQLVKEVISERKLHETSDPTADAINANLSEMHKLLTKTESSWSKDDKIEYLTKVKSLVDKTIELYKK